MWLTLFDQSEPVAHPYAADVFRAAPYKANAKVRAAFLGGAPVPSDIAEWCDRTIDRYCVVDDCASADGVLATQGANLDHGDGVSAHDASVSVSARRKVLIWIRHASYDSHRNTEYDEVQELARSIVAAGMVPILIGDALRAGEELPPDTVRRCRLTPPSG